MRKLILFILLLNIVSCTKNLVSPIQLEEDPQYVKTKCTDKFDEFLKVREISTPVMSNWKHDIGTDYILIAKDITKNKELKDLSKSSPIVYILQIATRSDDWKFIHSAYDNEGNSLPLKVVDSTVSSSNLRYSRNNITTTEYASIQLTKEYLKKHASGGMLIKLVGKRDNVILEVVPSIVQGFLLKLDEAKI